VEWEFEMLGNIELAGIVKCEAGEITKYGDLFLTDTASQVEEHPSPYCKVRLKRSDGKAMYARFVDKVEVNRQQFAFGLAVADNTPPPFPRIPIDFECENEMVCVSPVIDWKKSEHYLKCEQDDQL
ncbi:hypothetical protein PFISCL1PPCAC_22250, partial [Pristionchus fissidentatus]